MVESGGGTGVSDSRRVNLGMTGETSVDAPRFSQHSILYYYSHALSVEQGH